MKATVTSPWGDFDFNQPIREHIKYFMRQLKWMLKNNQSPNPTHTKTDLRGYKILYETASDETIYKFLNIKKRAGNRFQDNIAIINHMKVNGLWEDKIDEYEII